MNKFIKELIPYIVIIVVVVLIRTFIITPVIVSGDSMVPTLKDKQLLLLNKIDYRFNDISRFDIVVIKVDKNETIEYRNNMLYIDGHEVDSEYNFETDDFTLKSICNCEKIPQNKYLVLGDNRSVSADSRIIGLIDEKDIKGSVQISLWPIKKVK